ncbi:Hypothetical predicted protein, partial [Marmota monax]
ENEQLKRNADLIKEKLKSHELEYKNNIAKLVNEMKIKGKEHKIEISKLYQDMQKKGSVAVFELTQLALVSVAPEQMATVIYPGDGLTNEYAEHWYQQKPGLTPMMIIYGKSNQDSGIPDQFAGSNSGNIAMLTISRAQAGNEAEYCFQVWNNTNDAHSDSGR